MLDPLVEGGVGGDNHGGALVLALLSLHFPLEQQSLLQDVIALWKIGCIVTLQFGVLDIRRLKSRLSCLNSFFVDKADVAGAELMRGTVLLLHVNRSTADRGQ